MFLGGVPAPDPGNEFPPDERSTGVDWPEVLATWVTIMSGLTGTSTLRALDELSLLDIQPGRELKKGVFGGTSSGIGEGRLLGVLEGEWSCSGVTGVDPRFDGA